MHIYGIKSLQNGIGIFSVKMSVLQLHQACEVDYADPENSKIGYQRKPDERRFFDLANFLTVRDPKTNQNAILPPAIIASYRGSLKYTENENGFCTIDIPAGEKLWIIDGQHRFGGLLIAAGLYKAKQTGKKIDSFKPYHEKFRKFEIPVIIIESKDVNIEAYQFSIINSQAKKVDKYLATSGILKGGGPVPTNQNAWEARAVTVCQYLRSDPQSPLFGKIKHPNSKGRFWCTAKGMMNSLKFPLNTATYATEWENGNSEKICKMFLDYWRAWQVVAPFCFEKDKDFALFKASGLTAFNYCLPTIRDKIGKKFPSQLEFENILKKLGKYKSEEYWHINSSYGINRAVGLGQITDESNIICRFIINLNN
jgi:DGQHR domain-containing protein